jgi:hypothetical protein
LIPELETRRKLALENLRKELLDIPSFSTNQRRWSSLNGKVFTAKQIEEEMLKDSLTTEGLSLIKLWSVPTETIRREIQLARNRI